MAAIQKQQMRLALALIKQAGIKQVFQDGLVAEELATYRKRITVLRGCSAAAWKRMDQLIIDNDIKAVIPAEDAAAYRAANPVQDGRVVFDE
jgi:hypothetical protein